MKRVTKELGGKSSKDSTSYLLIRGIQLTLLETYIVYILEEKGACSDEEIAKILCIGSEEVNYIVTDTDGLARNNRIQGDYSRRTLKSTFCKKEYTIAKAKNGKLSVDHFEDVEDEKKLLEKYKCREIQGKEVPKSLKKGKADKYYLINGDSGK